MQCFRNGPARLLTSVKQGRGTDIIEAMLIFDTNIVWGATLQAPWQPDASFGKSTGRLRKLYIHCLRCWMSD